MASEINKREQLKELDIQMAQINALARKLKSDSANPNLLRVEQAILARKLRLNQEAKTKRALARKAKSQRLKRLRI